MAKGGGTDRVKDAVDAIKKYQDAADRRYKYQTSVLGFLNDYAMTPTYEKMVNKAEGEMKNKARVAKLSKGKESLMEQISSKMNEPKKMRKGGSVGSASKRADGCAVRGKTKGRMV